MCREEIIQRESKVRDLDLSFSKDDSFEGAPTPANTLPTHPLPRFFGAVWETRGGVMGRPALH